MLPDYTKINPILKLFASKNIPLPLIVITVIFGLFFGMMGVYVSNKIYLKRFVKYKNFYTSLKEYFKTVFLLFIPLCAACFVYIFYFDITNKNINKTPLKTVFSSYRIVEIKQPKKSDSVITYDASGNQKSEKPRTLFNVYLEQTKGIKTMELEYNVVLDVTKINKNSFDILLPNGQVATIKEKDAKGVFKTLKKINTNEREK